MNRITVLLSLLPILSLAFAPSASRPKHALRIQDFSNKRHGTTCTVHTERCDTTLYKTNNLHYTLYINPLQHVRLLFTPTYFTMAATYSVSTFRRHMPYLSAHFNGTNCIVSNTVCHLDDGSGSASCWFYQTNIWQYFVFEPLRRYTTVLTESVCLCVQYAKSTQTKAKNFFSSFQE